MGSQEKDEEAADTKVNDMMARCIAFAREKAAELGEAGDRDNAEVHAGAAKDEKPTDRTVEKLTDSSLADKAVEKEANGKADKTNSEKKPTARKKRRMVKLKAGPR